MKIISNKKFNYMQNLITELQLDIGDVKADNITYKEQVKLLDMKCREKTEEINKLEKRINQSKREITKLKKILEEKKIDYSAPKKRKYGIEEEK